MLVKFKDIPEWLHESQLYRDFDEDSEEEIEVKYLKDSEEINNFTEFKYILKISSFWSLDKIPYTVYVYAYYNKEEVENYLKIKTNNIYIDKYKEIEDDFYGNITLTRLKLKMINFLKRHNFSEKDIKKIDTKIKYKSKLRDSFDKLLKSKSDVFYLNLSEDIKKNKKLVYNINEFVDFYKKHKDYNYAKEFLKEYKKTPKYNFTTEYYEEETIDLDDMGFEGNDMYRIIIKLFDIDIFTIEGHFNPDYDEVDTEINDEVEEIYFGINGDVCIVHSYYKKEINIFSSFDGIKNLGVSTHCTIKYNIFNQKYIFDQIKNLKLYVYTTPF
uniref:Uncharacterized protein n=1 Tax=viral metagenome TaxID=1070528 RepID=A0A6C0AF18_9ZZZZ